MRLNKRGWLTFAWFVFGALMLALPPLVYELLVQSRHAFSPGLYAGFLWPHPVDPMLPFSQYEWWSEWKGWWQMIPIFLGGIFGALLSCVWLGWYFGVSLEFNGHNNEAGAVARIERFRQFIRFRLRENDLTGYVIAVDEPQKEGRLLSPKLIDVFRLVADKSSTTR